MRVWLIFLQAALLAACAPTDMALPPTLQAGLSQASASAGEPPEKALQGWLTEAHDLCNALRSVDERAYHDQCARSSRAQFLKAVAEEYRLHLNAVPDTATASARQPRGWADATGLSDAERRRAFGTIEQRLDGIAQEMAGHIDRSYWTGKVQAIARLEVLAQDMRQAISKPSLAPGDALELLPAAVLQADIQDTKRLLRVRQQGHALFPTPAGELTIAALNDHVVRVEAILSAQRAAWPGAHSGEIGKVFDVAAFDLARAGAAARERAWSKKQVEIHAAALGGLIDPDAAKPPIAGPPGRDWRVHDALFMKDADPTAYVAANAALYAEYDAMRREGRLGQPPPTFDRWRAGLMSDSGLVRAVHLATVEPDRFQPAFGFSDLLVQDLGVELRERRATHQTSKTIEAFDAMPPARKESLTERALFVRFASESYPQGSATMPKALRIRFDENVRAVSNESTQRIQSMVDRLFAITDKLVARPEAADTATVRDLAAVRHDLLQACTAHLDLLHHWEPERGVDLSADHDRLKDTYALLDFLRRGLGGDTREPRPDGDDPDPAPPSKPGGSPHSPRNGGGGVSPEETHWQAPAPGEQATSRSLYVDPKSAMAMARAQATLDDLESQLGARFASLETAANVPTTRTAAAINRSLARRTVADATFGRDRAAFDSMATSSEPRLPEGMPPTWETLIKSDEPGYPTFVFETEVRDFKTFKAVGGGIHLGATAALAASSAMAPSTVLRYDARTERLVLVPPPGGTMSRTLPMSEPIDASTLKALYLYVLSGHNLGVSIGWTGVVAKRDSAATPVLLDRMFVDTTVGQDLILADSIPWSLHLPKLPNGRVNPVRGPFCVAYRAFEKSSGTSLRDFLVNMGPVLDEAQDEEAWMPEMIVKYKESDEFTPAATSAQARAFQNWLQARLKTDEGELLSTGQISREVILLKAAGIAMKDKQLQQLAALGAVLRHRTGVSTDQVHSDAALAAGALIFDLLPRTTLAVLWDNDSSIRLHETGFSVDGTLHWRYAKRSMVFTKEEVSFRSLVDRDNEVFDIDDLNTIANGALQSQAMQKAYPPLARIDRDARVAALLRWARANANTVRMDLSALADVASFSRRTPTPDAIIRARSSGESTCPRS